MFKTHVVDCQCLLAFLQDNVPKHVSSSKLNPNLTKRICKRLLTEAIFCTLPKESIINQLNLIDYSLLSNVQPDELERLMDITMDNLKAILYNKSIDINNYAYLSCKFDGMFLYIKAGMEKCMTNYTSSTSTDFFET